MSIGIFFDDLNFQIIKIYAFYKVVLGKTCPAVAPEFRYGLIQPYGLPEVKTAAYLLQGLKDFVGAGVAAAVFHTGVLQHAVFFEGSCP